MFKDSDAFSGFSVDDMEKAKDFYGGNLGIDVEVTEAGLALRIPGRRGVHLPQGEPRAGHVHRAELPGRERRPGRGRPGCRGQRVEPTARTWARTRKGISRDPRGPVIAWFKDPAGNILSVWEAHTSRVA